MAANNQVRAVLSSQLNIRNGSIMNDEYFFKHRMKTAIVELLKDIDRKFATNDKNIRIKGSTEALIELTQDEYKGVSVRSNSLYLAQEHVFMLDDIKVIPDETSNWRNIVRDVHVAHHGDTRMHPVTVIIPMCSSPCPCCGSIEVYNNPYSLMCRNCFDDHVRFANNQHINFNPMFNALAGIRNEHLDGEDFDLFDTVKNCLVDFHLEYFAKPYLYEVEDDEAIASRFGPEGTHPRPDFYQRYTDYKKEAAGPTAAPAAAGGGERILMKWYETIDDEAFEVDHRYVSLYTTSALQSSIIDALAALSQWGTGVEVPFQFQVHFDEISAQRYRDVVAQFNATKRMHDNAQDTKADLEKVLRIERSTVNALQKARDRMRGKGMKVAKELFQTQQKNLGLRYRNEDLQEKADDMAVQLKLLKEQNSKLKQRLKRKVLTAHAAETHLKRLKQRLVSPADDEDTYQRTITDSGVIADLALSAIQGKRPYGLKLDTEDFANDSDEDSSSDSDSDDSDMEEEEDDDDDEEDKKPAAVSTKAPTDDNAVIDLT